MSVPYLHKQTGSALIVSLTILLVLTILGVSAMRTTSLEDKMAGNARDSQTAFEAAEFALRQAEQDLKTDVVVKASFGPTGGTGAYFTSPGVGPEAWTVEANWATIATPPGTVYTGNVASPPLIMIQQVDANIPAYPAPGIGNNYNYYDFIGLDVYQITVRGVGISPNSRAMLQSYYRE